MSEHPVIGFTGTRSGMTPEQKVTVTRLLANVPIGSTGVHGDCIGADADFDAICTELNIKTSCRPCTFDNMRAHTGAEQIAPPKPPMQRNRDIVADVTQDGALLACPPNYERLAKGSGTWATIGFGVRARKQVIIIFPDGTTREIATEALTSPPK